MIDKYAEIQDRITLYNACKGILRVKLAKYDEFKQRVNRYRAEGMDRSAARAQAAQELGLQQEPPAEQPPAEQPPAEQPPTESMSIEKQPSTAQPYDMPEQLPIPAPSNQLAASPQPQNNNWMYGAAGAAAGGAAGYAGTSLLNKKLGLTADRGGWRKWLGRGLSAAGTLGGAAGGYYLGNRMG